MLSLIALLAGHESVASPAESEHQARPEGRAGGSGALVLRGRGMGVGLQKIVFSVGAKFERVVFLGWAALFLLALPSQQVAFHRSIQSKYVGL